MKAQVKLWPPLTEEVEALKHASHSQLSHGNWARAKTPNAGVGVGSGMDLQGAAGDIEGLAAKPRGVTLRVRPSGSSTDV